MAYSNKEIIIKTIISNKILTSAYRICVLFFIKITKHVEQTLRQIDDVCYDRVKVDSELICGSDQIVQEEQYAIKTQSISNHHLHNCFNVASNGIHSETFPGGDFAHYQLVHEKERTTCRIRTFSRNKIMYLKALSIICVMEVLRVIRETLKQIDDVCYDRDQMQTALLPDKQDIEKSNNISITTKLLAIPKHHSINDPCSKQICYESFCNDKYRATIKATSSRVVKSKQLYPKGFSTKDAVLLRRTKLDIIFEEEEEDYQAALNRNANTL